MGVKLERKKPRQLWLSLIYRFCNLPWASSKKKLKIFMNLEWAFDRLALEESFHVFDNQIHPVRKYSRNFLLPLIESNHRVLDLGCKEGIMSDYLATKAKEVIGIDFHEPSINTAKNTYERENLKFEAREALEYLNETNDKFDVIILSHILEHLDEPAKFLSDFKDYFKFFYIEVPDFDRFYMNHYRKDLKVELVYSDHDHINEFDRDELSDIINSVGLEIEKSEFRYGVQKFWCKNPKYNINNGQ